MGHMSIENGWMDINEIMLHFEQWKIRICVGALCGTDIDTFQITERGVAVAEWCCEAKRQNDAGVGQINSQWALHSCSLPHQK